MSGIGVNVSSNAQHLYKELDAYTPREVKLALVRSLNKTADGVVTDASRFIRDEYNIKRNRLSPAFKIRRATFSTLTAVVSASGTHIPLYAFAPRPDEPRAKGKRLPRAGGVSVSVRKGSRKLIRGSFIARMKSGHVGVFVRTGKKMPSNTRRDAIRELSTIDVPQMFGAKQVMKAVNAAAKLRFETAMEQNIRFTKARIYGD